MIITRTPFRITLGGGGTDLPSFYQHHGGFIFAMGIDKYMYVMTNPPTVDNKIRLHYSQTEIVNHVSELQHELAREALSLNRINEKIEVSSMADLPDGTGVGSSSCYLVGLLNALHHYRRDYVSLKKLAEEACYIELDVLKKGIGKQDQYMATFGGLTVLEIRNDGHVKVRSVDLGSSSIASLVANAHVYYTGLRRSAEEMLKDQNMAMQSKANPQYEQVSESLCRIKELGYKTLDAIEQENFDRWGLLLDEHWQYKKRLSSKISLSVFDELYELVKKKYGVLGGKILGAGGGGFLLLYCPKEHKKLEQHMLSLGMPRLHYTIEMEGSKVIANMATTKSMVFHPNAPFPSKGQP